MEFRLSNLACAPEFKLARDIPSNNIFPSNTIPMIYCSREKPMPRGRPSTQDHITLQMALVGYEVEKQRIEERIREIQAQLGHGRGRPSLSGGSAQKETSPKRRVLSTAARKRIAAAQRKRWAEHRKRVAAEAK